MKQNKCTKICQEPLRRRVNLLGVLSFQLFVNTIDVVIFVNVLIFCNNFIAVPYDGLSEYLKGTKIVAESIISQVE